MGDGKQFVTKVGLDNLSAVLSKGFLMCMGEMGEWEMNMIAFLKTCDATNMYILTGFLKILFLPDIECRVRR